MKKRCLKGIVVLLLVVMMLPVKVWAAGTTEEADVVEMTPDETKYYLELYGGGTINPRNGVFADLTLGVLKDDTRLMVVYSTNTRETASELGTKEIILEVKSGIFWVPVATLERASRSDARMHSGGFYFNNPVKGNTYRAAAIHYAIINGKEYTSYARTNGTTF